MNSYSLKELLEIKNGKDHKHLLSGNIPVLGSGGIMRYGNEFLYEEESILLPRKGSLNNIQYINTPFWTVDTLYYTVVNKEKAEPYYLYNFIKILDLSRLNSGTGVPSMTFSAYYGIKVNLPKLSIQKQIAKILSDLDTKIELNNKINQELEAMAKMIYDYWFVQFDFPMSKEQALALGKPELEGKPYKASGGKMVYNQQLKREIPEGWEDGSILACASLEGGGTPKKEINEYWNGNTPFFTPTDSDSNIFCIKTKIYTNILGISKSSTQLFEKGTVFITARGSVGKINVAGVSMAMNQSCYALVPLRGFSSEFIYFHTDQIVHYLKAKSSGSIFKAIVTNDFKFTPSLVPKQDLVSKFTETVKPMFEKILNNQNQNQELTYLRDWLLPMLMNGQVTVKEGYALSTEALGMVAEPNTTYKKTKK